jgi:hypothetical protein
LFEVPGVADDRLYRESALPSFWETLFGSGLRRRARTVIESDADGNRLFRVPVEAIRPAIVQSLAAWIDQKSAVGARDSLGVHSPTPTSRPVAAWTDRIWIRLDGSQAPGSPLARFRLQIGISADAGNVDAAAHPATILEDWWREEGPGLVREVLIPFGFTPQNQT